MTIALVGLDLAKDIFHIHAVDEKGREVLRKKLYRDEVKEYFANLQSSRIVMEACGGSNYWAREIAAMGHKAELISPQYVLFLRAPLLFFICKETIRIIRR